MTAGCEDNNIFRIARFQMRLQYLNIKHTQTEC